MDSHRLGQFAEEAAYQFLRSKGLQLIEKNYRCFDGEIDLIMQERSDIVFIEVRQRSSQDYGNALESITKVKMKKLIKTATHFLQKKRWLYTINSRFDIITIQTTQGKTDINWIKNAFWVDA